jgi:hypothetical protein
LGLAEFRNGNGGGLGKGRQRNKPEGGSVVAFVMLEGRHVGCAIAGSHERPMY